MKFVRIRDTVLHVRHHVADGGATIVFINSLGTDMRIWDSLIQLLDRRLGVVAYDKRGHGLSALGDAPETIETHAADLAGLLDHLGVARAIVCGLSIGGLIAQGLYQARPDLINGLLLCGTAARIGTAESWNRRIQATLSKGIASFADDVLQLWFTPDFHRCRSEELAGYRTMLTRQLPTGYAAACAAIRDADFTATAKDIDVPVLCVAGDHDGTTPPALVRSLALSIPRARFETVAGAGHIPCVEQPGRLAALVGSLAASVKGQTA